MLCYSMACTAVIYSSIFANGGYCVNGEYETQSHTRILYSEMGCHLHLLVRDWVPFPPLQKIIPYNTAEWSGRDWDAISTIASHHSIP